MLHSQAGTNPKQQQQKYSNQEQKKQPHDSTRP